VVGCRRGQALAWTAWIEDPNEPLPDLLADEWDVFREGSEIPLTHLTEPHDRRLWPGTSIGWSPSETNGGESGSGRR
jgi:hypothetical protein